MVQNWCCDYTGKDLDGLIPSVLPLRNSNLLLLFCIVGIFVSRPRRTNAFFECNGSLYVCLLRFWIASVSALCLFSTCVDQVASSKPVVYYRLDLQNQELIIEPTKYFHRLCF